MLKERDGLGAAASPAQGGAGAGGGPGPGGGAPLAAGCGGGGGVCGGTEPAVCGGCGGRITDRFYLLAVDRRWHAACLKCCECKLPLDSELTCFARDGNIYCKDDYYRLFAVKRCGRCRAGISASELVMRARDLVYHLHCFTCASCGAALAKGDLFGVRDGLVYCRPHFELLLLHGGCAGGDAAPPHGAPAADSTLPPAAAPSANAAPGPGSLAPSAIGPALPGAFCGVDLEAVFRGGDGGGSPFFGGGGGGAGGCGAGGGCGAAVGVQKGRPRKRKLTHGSSDGAELPVAMRIPAAALELLHSGDLSSSMDGLSGYDAGVGSPGNPSGGPGQQQQRTKRMRTSFKHHQLRTMKSYFAINQNPDAKDLKQLAQKTGLSKRVLQVWFQNARAKWRRNLMRQESGGSVGAGPGAAPGVAAGPGGAPPSLVGDGGSGAGGGGAAGGPPGPGAGLPPPPATPEELQHHSHHPHHLHHHGAQPAQTITFADLY